MQKIRPKLVGAVTLVLLAIVSGSTAARDDATMEASSISGTMSVVREVDGPEVVTSPDSPQERGTGWVFELALTTDDPRLSGTAVADHDYLAFTSGATGGRVWWGSGRLANDLGSWRVELQGFAQPGEHFLSNNHYVVWYRGEGAFVGLTAMMVALPTGPGEWDVEGVLFPGSLPEVPAVPG